MTKQTDLGRSRYLLTIQHEDYGTYKRYFFTKQAATDYADNIMESMDVSEARETGFSIEPTEVTR